MIQNGSSYQLHCYYCRNVISNKSTASQAQYYTTVFSKSQPQVYSLEYVYFCILIKKKDCIYKTLPIVRQFHLPYHKVVAHVAIVRSWKEWKLTYATKKLRQYKTKILKLSLVVNTKSSHNVSHRTLGFMQFPLIDECCR